MDRKHIFIIIIENIHLFIVLSYKRVVVVEKTVKLNKEFVSSFS